jgi:exocyst complex component 4
LTDILIEELHNHLYLKSPYCEARWKQYTNQQNKSMATNGEKPAVEVRVRHLFQYLDGLDTGTTVMRDDPTRNPEADSFVYIQLLVESLHSLGRLDAAVDNITQRLPVELFKVVERSGNEADQRHPSSARGAKAGQDQLEFSNSAKASVLTDLLETLFARFEAIAEGHRVVHEVISGILKREGLRTSSTLTSGFRELWKLFQSEIRSLLHDYLTAGGNLAYRSGQGNDRASNVFSRTQRDKTKKMFKLTDMDSKSTDITTEREDLDLILKSSVPGLVSDSKRPDTTNQSNATASIDGSATGHKLLVEPSVFNMAALLPPSLGFLNRLKEVVPPTSDIALSTLTSFLDDFLVNVFLPQLEETLVDLCAQTFIESDAFQQDPQWANHSKKPVFKGTVKFHALITAFCKLLDNLPHDQQFSQLIIVQMVTYYDKCCGWYKALVSRTQPNPKTGKRVKMAATMAEEEEMKDIVSALLRSNASETQDLIQKESALLIKSSDEASIDEADILSDRRNISALCLLFTSMKWIAAKITHLRYISHSAIDSSRRDSRRHTKSLRWTLITTAEKQIEAGRVYLPLNADSAIEFDGVVSSYHELAAIVLRMLHVEIRCHIVYHMNMSMSRTFLLNTEHNDPDPEVLALNSDVVNFDEEVAAHLQEPQQTYVCNCSICSSARLTTSQFHKVWSFNSP